MKQHYPILVIIVPLLSAFLVSAAGWFRRRYCFPVATGALAVTLFASVGLLSRVLQENLVHYRLGGWPPPWGIAYAVDHLNSLVLVVVATVALVNLIANRRQIEEQFKKRPGRSTPFTFSW